MGLFQKIFGSKNERELRKLQPIVDRIASLEAKIKTKSDAELKATTGELRRSSTTARRSTTSCRRRSRSCAKPACASSRCVTTTCRSSAASSCTRAASPRCAPARARRSSRRCRRYLNALAGKGVHVVTVNDYLARRDAEWMGRLQLPRAATGVVVHGLEDFERQAAYNCDITYGQNNEFGFDYLRDNMKLRAGSHGPARPQLRGRRRGRLDPDRRSAHAAHHLRSAEQSADPYVTVDRLIPRLKREVDYTVDEKAHQAMLTDDGVEKIEQAAQTSTTCTTPRTSSSSTT